MNEQFLIEASLNHPHRTVHVVYSVQQQD